MFPANVVADGDTGFRLEPNRGGEMKAVGKRIIGLDKNGLIVNKTLGRNLQNAHPTGQFCHIADKFITGLDVNGSSPPAAAETGNIPIGIGEGLIGLRRKEINVICHVP